MARLQGFTDTLFGSHLALLLGAGVLSGFHVYARARDQGDDGRDYRGRRRGGLSVPFKCLRLLVFFPRGLLEPRQLRSAGPDALGKGTRLLATWLALRARLCT